MSEKDKTPAYYFDPRQAQAEADCLDQRQSPPTQPEQTPEQRISDSLGLALSGGGIRSATFNLGLLQALAAQGKLKDFAYLSTVSGGGYIGSFLGRLFHRAQEENPAGTPTPDLVADVERKLASDEAPIIRWLRDNGRYLAPHGAHDRLFAAAIYLRNMLSVHAFLGVILFSAFILLAWLRAWLSPDSPPDMGTWNYSPGPVWGGVMVLMAGFLASAWAYWMIRRDRRVAWLQVVIAVGLGVGALWLLSNDVGGPSSIRSLATWWQGWGPRDSALLLVATIALPAPLIALAVRWSSTTQARIRNRLSKLLSCLLTATLALTGLALLDDLALACVQLFEKDTANLSLFGAGATGALLAGLRALAERLSVGVGKLGSSGSGLALKGLVGVAGVLLLLLVAFGWGVAAYAVAGSQVVEQLPLGTLTLAATVILLLMLYLYRSNLDFLNLSSLHQFYAARLTRAYLGAGNSRRSIAWTEKPVHSRNQPPVSDVVEGDDLSLWISGTRPTDTYAPHLRGGPLHLINVNVNQTRYSSTGNFQPDRKGWNLAVGPAGLNLGRTYWQDAPWQDAEALSLGCWVSISGAAFSTGAGPRTSLGFSALLGLLGVRLGYWWHAGQENRPKCTLTTAQALLAELTGNFNPDGTNYWYLSDGGHFENTAAYELIRRRLKRIVVADCGADLEYGFEDIANLVLKARIDFDAEIEFFSDADLDTLWNGTPWRRCFFAPQLGLPKTGDAPLALARVHYPDDPEYGWLLVVKPRLPTELPTDLARYAAIAPDFPQQSTADQFYDEAQWESTRKLGRLLGDHLVDSLSALDVAWATYIAGQPAVEGADWTRPVASPAPGTEEAPKQAGVAKLLALYTPLVIALWTGFEFYSNYQKSQAAAAEDKVKFVLARLDRLEEQATRKPYCAAVPVSCPTAAAQLSIAENEVTALDRIKDDKARALLDISTKLRTQLGLDRPEPSSIVSIASQMASASPTASTSTRQEPSPPQEEQRLQEAIEQALVYVQIYGEETRDVAQDVITRLQAAGLKSTQTPGIENVTRSAQARGRKPPDRFARVTVIYYHPEDRKLAEWIVRSGLEGKGYPLDLSRAYKNVRSHLVEIWLP
ncbi:patatin-like phospholipase family protein [Crenobacter cavernae]|uniref:Uncharacterized protein n=1 Tax=Crenobacter cavernae TaxID=2290923 RepID=A0A345Y8D3_9NEIS|nr:patatin-like phospholipase family protein [Crenobacter cavernae]AXK40185.1 hypothetical protein DWG20_12435 [Crenobacter cavernae]